MTDPNFLTHIILTNPERVIKSSKATKKQLIEWINQAPTVESRLKRKQLMYVFMYNAGPKTFLEALETYKNLGIHNPI
jgi:hypothetical protein